MDKLLDEALSKEIGKKIKSKPKKPFDNAYKAALVTEGATYVQGFLVFAGQPYRPVEHAWIEINHTTSDESGVCIIDPTLNHLNKNSQSIWYYSAHSIKIKKLKAILEESQEDYPEDDPLPIYGDAPYEYYGNVMLGGKNYLEAYQAAEAKCKELNERGVENN
jgi:hypothetical protein